MVQRKICIWLFVAWLDLFLELTLKMIDIEKELKNAKKASIGASKILINERENVNKILSNEGRDVKLKADVESEKIIKEFLTANSKFPILAEESELIKI